LDSLGNEIGIEISLFYSIKDKGVFILSSFRPFSSETFDLNECLSLKAHAFQNNYSWKLKIKYKTKLKRSLTFNRGVVTPISKSTSSKILFFGHLIKSHGLKNT
jgi:hypothetical protein